MRYMYLLGAACLCFQLSLAQDTKDKRLKGLDKELEGILETWVGPGFAVAIIEKDQIIYEKGFGYRDYENKLPVTPNTQFAIGSATKAFTSSLLGMLRDEGELSFRDKPEAYIPGFSFYNEEMNQGIIIQDLMCHRTGLPRHDASWYFFPNDDRMASAMRIQHQEPSAMVRERFQYNNFMFMLQGVIAEQITGDSWEDLIQARIFDPLGMNHSLTQIGQMPQATEPAKGYEVDETGKVERLDYKDITAMNPAGSICSSVHEMSNWVMTWIQQGRFQDSTILPAGYRDEAINSHMVLAGGAPGKDRPNLHMINYGYGWFLLSYKGHYRVEHGGNIDGFSANVCFFPSDSIGIIVLTNQNGSSIPSVVRNTIADRMLEVEKTDWNGEIYEEYQEGLEAQKAAKGAVSTSRIEGTSPSHGLQDYAGHYSNPGYGTLELVYLRDSLFAYVPEDTLWISHYHYDVFVPTAVENGRPDTSESIASEIKFQFESDMMGEINRVKITLEPSVDPIEFERKPAEVVMAAEALAMYEGEYEFAGNAIKIYRKGGNVLYAFVPGQPEYELAATGDHKFRFKDLDGFKMEFKPNEAGEITEVVITQPNGVFTATRKE